MNNSFSLLVEKEEAVEEDLQSEREMVDGIGVEGDDKSEDVHDVDGALVSVEVQDVGKSGGSLGLLIEHFEGKALEEKIESSPKFVNKKVGCVIEMNLFAFENSDNSCDLDTVQTTDQFGRDSVSVVVDAKTDNLMQESVIGKKKRGRPKKKVVGDVCDLEAQEKIIELNRRVEAAKITYQHISAIVVLDGVRQL